MLKEYGLAEAKATNDARDAQLDRFDLTAEERAAGVAIFADATRPVGPDWWGTLAARRGWKPKR